MRTQKFFGVDAAQAREIIAKAQQSDDPIIRSRANSVGDGELKSAYFCMQQEAIKFGSVVTSVNRGFEQRSTCSGI